MTALAEPARQGQAAPALWPARRLLLIDDNSLVGRFLADAAEECGCIAVREPTMARFQQAYHDDLPDIVAVDLSVSGYNGGEVLSFLAAERYQGLVLIISGLDHRKLNAALRLGISSHLNILEPLSKPFRIDDLAHRLGGKPSSLPR